jgi:HD-like signal output (HDOD) protein
VIALCSRPDTHVEQVAEAVAADPALAAEVLRLANSASVGGRAEVTDLGRALVTIGLQRLNTMAAALSMFAVFSKKTELSLGLHDRAVLAGALARSLAGELRSDRSIAFVCGLLSEIGAMAMLSLDAAEYARLYRAAGTNATERERLENLRYGISARELGGALMRKNGIPETLAAAVEASPEGAGASTDVMHKLTVFAREASITLSADVTPGTLSAQSLGQRLEHVLSVLGIAVPPERIVELCLGAATKTVNVLRRVR